MIKINNKDVSGIYKGSDRVLAIYKGAILVWTIKKIIDEIESCYFNGYWEDKYSWTDDTPWTD